MPPTPIAKWHHNQLKFKVRCCAPHLSFADVTYTCIACEGINVRCSGWTHGPRGRWILDHDEPYLLCSYTYTCNDCMKVCMCSDPRALAFLGFDRGQTQDFVLSHRSGISRSLLSYLQWAVTGGMSFSGFLSMVKARWYEVYDSKRCTYAGNCARQTLHFESNQENVEHLFGDTPVTRCSNTPLHTPYPTFTSRGINGYNGLCPSRNLLKMFFVNSVR